MAKQPWADTHVPDSVALVPSMLTHEELQYLIWLGQTTYSASGAIVDLGPWLGSSTAALAEGLRRSGVASRVVHAFDLFEWRREYMEQYAPEDLPDGADFRRLLVRNTSGYHDLIRAEKMNLLDPAWDGGPIEVLFVDAAKTWGLLEAILNCFGPHLIPGKSRVVLQDFRYFHTYWLPLVFDSRPDLWAEVEAVASGTTNSFLLLKSFAGPAGAHAEYRHECFPLRSARHLLRQRIAQSTSEDRATYLLMLYRVACVDDDAELLAETRRELLEGARGDDLGRIEAQMVMARRFSADERIMRAWEALARHDIELARREIAPSWLQPHADLLTVRGRIAQLEGDAARAIELYRESLRLDESSPNFALLFRAECHVAIGNYAECTVDVMRQLATGRAPTRDILSWVARLLEDCWTKEQNRETAQAGSAKLLEMFPRSPELLVLAGLVARACEQLELARTRAAAALELDPMQARARWLLGELGPAT